MLNIWGYWHGLSEGIPVEGKLRILYEDASCYYKLWIDIIVKLANAGELLQLEAQSEKNK